jgi:hypothetical protein
MGLSLPKDTTEDQRHAAWVDVIRRASDEHTGQAWSNYMFRLLRAIARSNPWLAENGGFFADWIVRSYVDSTLMLLRRELDKQAGSECLLQLLYDMLENPTVVTRTRFVANWPANTREWLADKEFSKYAGGSGEHLSLDMINADLERLKEAETIRAHAEQTRAHRKPVRAVDPRTMTFEELHKALVSVRDVVNKYRGVLGVGPMSQWQPVEQFSVIEPFLRPWIENVDQANEVRRLSREDRP